MKSILLMIIFLLVGCDTHRAFNEWLYSDAIQITLSREAIEKEKSIVVDVVVKND